MPFTIRPLRRFAGQCAVTYNAGGIPRAAAALLVGPWVGRSGEACCTRETRAT